MLYELKKNHLYEFIYSSGSFESLENVDPMDCRNDYPF